MNMESKFKVGDRVRILDCPVMPDVVGKSGVIRHGKVIYIVLKSMVKSSQTMLWKLI